MDRRTVSVGIGPTKTLAKAANHLAKPWQGYYYKGGSEGVLVTLT
jgi:hypothetical protein